ncbi:hypothetical protein [Denitratisoma oestradiolicum]|nr:hypothetical protein [Denitratisoma oestradiolicum]
MLHNPTFNRTQPRYAGQLHIEAVEKPIFHPEQAVKMAQDFLRHFHFIQ